MATQVGSNAMGGLTIHYCAAEDTADLLPSNVNTERHKKEILSFRVDNVSGDMGQCSGKLGGGHSASDVVSNTAWVREVVTTYQKRRRGISKFCNFTFQPLGASCDGQEEYHGYVSPSSMILIH